MRVPSYPIHSVLHIAPTEWDPRGSSAILRIKDGENFIKVYAISVPYADVLFSCAGWRVTLPPVALFVDVSIGDRALIGNLHTCKENCVI